METIQTIGITQYVIKTTLYIKKTKRDPTKCMTKPRKLYISLIHVQHFQFNVVDNKVTSSNAKYPVASVARCRQVGCITFL